MSMSVKIGQYEDEWIYIAQKIHENQSITLPLGDKKQAANYRFLFYGFRKALGIHDPSNIYLKALLETKATITANGDLQLTRNPLAGALSELFKKAIITPKVPAPETSTPSGEPSPLTPSAPAPDGAPKSNWKSEAHDDAVLRYLNFKPQEPLT